MSSPVFRKQISIFVPLTDWKALRQEAARQRVPMTEICRRWMEPGFQSLRLDPDRPPMPDDQDED